jgi:hypothetical protein
MMFPSLLTAEPENIEAVAIARWESRNNSIESEPEVYAVGSKDGDRASVREIWESG